MRIPLLLLLALLTLGCWPKDPPREGTLHRDETTVHDGVTRSYHFYETAQDGARPLVLLLHGGSGNIDTHIGVGAARWPHQVWLDIADEEGLHLLVPQGLQTHWNDCRAECDRCGEADDVGFLVGLIDDLAGRYAIDTSRVYVVGESNGGFMAQRLAQEAADRFAAIGVVIALQPTNNQCAPSSLPMPVLYQVGTADAAIPYEGGQSDSAIDVLSAAETIAYWQARNGCAGDPTTATLQDLDDDDGSTVRRADYPCSSAPLAFLTIEGGGHVPASVSVQVSALWEGIAGTQNHDIEGARVFWEFFQGQRRE